MHTLFSFLFAIALAAPAAAQTFITSDVHRNSSGGYSVETRIDRGQAFGGWSTSPGVIEMRKITPADRAAWIERCKPTDSRPDRYGVTHVVYAAPGCQFGP
jgi:hypothetical protein